MIKTVTLGSMTFELPFTTEFSLAELPIKSRSTLKTSQFLRTFTSPENDSNLLRTKFLRLKTQLTDSGFKFITIQGYTNKGFIISAFHPSGYYVLLSSNDFWKYAYKMSTGKVITETMIKIQVMIYNSLFNDYYSMVHKIPCTENSISVNYTKEQLLQVLELVHSKECLPREQIYDILRYWFTQTQYTLYPDGIISNCTECTKADVIF